jgi:tetratricopeptide (TPR) repeat protein
MRIVQDSRLHGQMLDVRLSRATLAILQGHFAEAEHERRALTAEATRLQSGNTLHALGLQLFGLRFLQGRMVETLPLIPVVGARNPDYAGMTHAAYALALASAGRLDEARDEIEQVATIGFSNLPDATWLVALTFLAEALFLLGSARHAREIYTLLEPFADRTAMWIRSYCGGSVTRSLAQLSTLLEDYDAAAHHFETALRRNREMKAAPFVALTEHDHACMLARQGSRSGTSRSIELLRSALTAAEALGMQALCERAARSLASVQKPSRSRNKQQRKREVSPTHGETRH